MAVVKTIASIGKHSAEPIDAYLFKDHKESPRAGTSAFVDLVAWRPSHKEGKPWHKALTCRM
jgi:hypothetical protein